MLVPKVPFRFFSSVLLFLGVLFFSSCYNRDTFYQNLITPNGYLMVQTLTENNEIIKGVSIELLDPSILSDETKKMLVIDKLETNSEGSVYFGYVQPGKYVVRLKGSIDSKAFDVETSVQVTGLERNFWILYPTRYTNIVPVP